MRKKVNVATTGLFFFLVEFAIESFKSFKIKTDILKVEVGDSVVGHSPDFCADSVGSVPTP